MERADSKEPSRDSTRPLDWTTARSLWAALSGGGQESVRAQDRGPLANAPDVEGYTIEARIGGGGGGDVYRARRHADGRLAAMKFIRVPSGIAVSGDPVRRARAFENAWREIEIHKDLPPACVPEYLDEGLHDGGLWFATEFIAGKPIDEYCEAAGLSPRDRARLLAEVCECVQSLHDRAIIHKDIKPSNILVMPSGRVRIIDFGISVRSAVVGRDAPVGAERPETGSEQTFACGTPAYMAPEQTLVCKDQSLGKHIPITNRSDVFALGATGFVLLLGDVPHQSDPASKPHQALLSVASIPARDPLELQPDLSPPLAAVLRKAVAHRPADRYASPKEFSDDLRRWADGRRVAAIPRGGFGRALDWANEHRAAASFFVGVAVFLLCLTATVLSVWWINQRPYKFDGTRLIAASGRILADWSHGEPYKVVFGALVDRPSSLGGGQLVLVGAGPKEPAPELRAYDGNNPDTVLWSSGFGADRFTAPPRQGFEAASAYWLVNATLADVFPDRPGVEIVASHAHRVRGACCIRVYDLAGTVLYEVWHYGHIYDLRWLSGPKLLVLLGVNSEALWKFRGHPEAHMEWPVVVLAVRPEVGTRAGWITTPSHAGDSPPHWYRCVMPPDLVLPSGFDKDVFNLGSPQYAMYDDATHFSLVVGLRPAIVDSHGEVVKRLQFAHMQQNAGKRRDAERLGSQAESEPQLVDLPPIIDKAKAGSDGEWAKPE